MIVETMETKVTVLGRKTSLQQVGGRPIVRRLPGETVVQQVEQLQHVPHQAVADRRVLHQVEKRHRKPRNS